MTDRLPVLRHVAQPLDAGGLEADVGIEAAGDGPVDDGLLLLLQQRMSLRLALTYRRMRRSTWSR